MRLVALRLIALWGWRRAGLALLLGVVSALAMAPVKLLPVLLITFPLLVWLLDGVQAQGRSSVHRFRTGAVVGLCFGFGYFLTGLHWVGAAFYVDAEAFAWMMPVVIALLTLLLAIFWALAGAAAAALWTTGASRIFILAAAFAAADWMRGHIFTGFPWNTLGYAASASDALAQLASIGGVYGLGFLVVLFASAPALLGTEDDRRIAGVRSGWLCFAVLAVVFGALWGVGNGLLSSASDGEADGLSVRIVQPNIDQQDKWDPAHRSQIFATYLELSDTATSPQYSGVVDVDMLIWPESALPFFMEEDSGALAAIAALVPDNVTLLTGALRRAQVDGEVKVYNSVLALDGSGSILARYDKFHLVPFGEYLPLEPFLASFGFRQLVTVPRGFSAGSAPATLALGIIPAFSPLICYEIIFPGAVIDEARRPEWLLNVTNDAWFGASIGPHQHIEHARFRAIEEGLPIVRAANTGISAVIDSHGQVLQSLAIGKRGVIDARLPPAAAPTVYSRWRDWPLAMVIAIAFLLAVAMQFYESRRLSVPIVR
jgi:apolipoprotein N-acyltransferase